LKKVVVMNLLFGLMSPRIDNWGHVGGLLGGSYVSFFFGPEKVRPSPDPHGHPLPSIHTFLSRM